MANGFEQFDRQGTNRSPSLGTVEQQQSQFVQPNIFEPKKTEPIPAFDPNSFALQGRNVPPAAIEFQQAPQSAQPQPQFDVAPPVLTPAQIAGAPTPDLSQSAPFVPQVPTPGGFQVSGQRAMTPEEVARQEEIRKGIESGAIGTGAPAPGTQGAPLTTTEAETIKALGGGLDAERAVREAKQQQTIKESGARSASKKIESSLLEQGISGDAIKEAIKGSKTMQDKFEALNRLQKKETLKRLDVTRNQRVADRITSKARRNADGTPKNDAAVAEDFDNFFTEINPETDKPNIELMTPSQKREYKRFLDKASRGSVSDSETGRIEKIQERIARKIEVGKETKVVAERNRKLQQSIDDAATKEEKDFYSTRQSQLKGIDSRLEGKFSREEKKDGGLEDQLKAQQSQINQEIAAGFQPQGEQGIPTVTTQEQFDALPSGAAYLNRSGQTATKP